MRQIFSFFLDEFLEFFNSQILDQEFDPRAAAIFLLAAGGEHPGNGLRQRQQFIRGDKRVVQFRLVRNGAQPSAHVGFKPALFNAILDACHGDQSDVMHTRKTASVLRATAESRLEFPAEILTIGMPQQKFGHRAGVGSDIERFVRADARVRAGRDVAHRIAAGLSCGDSRCGQAAHHSGRIFDVHVVQLKILASGDVGDTVGILLRQFRQCFQLRGVEPAARNFDALHARSVPHGVRPLGQGT